MKDLKRQSRKEVPSKDNTEMKDPKGQSRNEVPSKNNTETTQRDNPRMKDLR